MINNEGGKQEIIIARHLRDRDELSTHGLDSGLLPDQERGSERIAEEILKHCNEARLNNILIFSSIKQRALETAKQIEGYLSQNNSDIGVEIREEPSLRELDQGKVVLPEGFKDGDTFKPLHDAWDVFYEETFTKNNLLYKFGDPMMGGDNSAKYENLRGHFSSYGESYAQFIMRIYDSLVSISKELNFSEKPFGPVLVLHGAAFSIVRDLADIGRDIDRSMLKNIPFGTLVRRGWDEYQKNKATRKDPGFGEMEVVDVTSLMKPEIIEIVAIESDRMRALLMQAK